MPRVRSKLLLLGADGVFRRIDAATLAEDAETAESSDASPCVAVSPKGDLVISAEGKSANGYALPGLKFELMLTRSTEPLVHVAFSADGSKIAASGEYVAKLVCPPLHIAL